MEETGDCNEEELTLSGLALFKKQLDSSHDWIVDWKFLIESDHGLARLYFEPVVRHRIAPFHMAIAKSCPLELIEQMLEQHPELVHCVSGGGDLPLHYAAASHNYKYAKLLIQKDKRLENSLNHTSRNTGAFGDQVLPLHVAIQTKAPNNIIALLVKHCPSTAVVMDGRGDTPVDMVNRIYHGAALRRVSRALKGGSILQARNTIDLSTATLSLEIKSTKKKKEKLPTKKPIDKTTQKLWESLSSKNLWESLSSRNLFEGRARELFEHSSTNLCEDQVTSSATNHLESFLEGESIRMTSRRRSMPGRVTWSATNQIEPVIEGESIQMTSRIEPVIEGESIQMTSRRSSMPGRTPDKSSNADEKNQRESMISALRIDNPSRQSPAKGRGTTMTHMNADSGELLSKSATGPTRRDTTHAIPVKQSGGGILKTATIERVHGRQKQMDRSQSHRSFGLASMNRESQESRRSLPCEKQQRRHSADIHGWTGHVKTLWGIQDRGNRELQTFNPSNEIEDRTHGDSATAPSQSGAPCSLHSGSLNSERSGTPSSGRSSPVHLDTHEKTVPSCVHDQPKHEQNGVYDEILEWKQYRSQKRPGPTTDSTPSNNRSGTPSSRQSSAGGILLNSVKTATTRRVNERQKQMELSQSQSQSQRSLGLASRNGEQSGGGILKTATAERIHERQKQMGRSQSHSSFGPASMNRESRESRRSLPCKKQRQRHSEYVRSDSLRSSLRSKRFEADGHTARSVSFPEPEVSPSRCKSAPSRSRSQRSLPTELGEREHESSEGRLRRISKNERSRTNVKDMSFRTKTLPGSGDLLRNLEKLGATSLLRNRMNESSRTSSFKRRSTIPEDKASRTSTRRRRSNVGESESSRASSRRRRSVVSDDETSRASASRRRRASHDDEVSRASSSRRRGVVADNELDASRPSSSRRRGLQEEEKSRPPSSRRRSGVQGHDPSRASSSRRRTALQEDEASRASSSGRRKTLDKDETSRTSLSKPKRSQEDDALRTSSSRHRSVATEDAPALSRSSPIRRKRLLEKLTSKTSSSRRRHTWQEDEVSRASSSRRRRSAAVDELEVPRRPSSGRRRALQENGTPRTPSIRRSRALHKDEASSASAIGQSCAMTEDALDVSRASRRNGLQEDEVSKASSTRRRNNLSFEELFEEAMALEEKQEKKREKEEKKRKKKEDKKSSKATKSHTSLELTEETKSHKESPNDVRSPLIGSSSGTLDEHLDLERSPQ